MGVFLILSIGLTWPLLPSFRDAIVGEWDARHFLWLLWHAREAIFGREPFYETKLLYYPHGTSLAAFSMGPAGGVLALPFFPLGPEAAYNGALLLGFVLTGCAAYVLARAIGFDRAVSLFVGVVYTSAPIHLSALTGHFHKAFLAPLPLVAMATLAALDPHRSAWWALAAALSMLVALLQSGEQLVFGAIVMIFFAAARLFFARGADRRTVFGRACLTALGTFLATLPALIPVLRLFGDPAVVISRTWEVETFRPDLVQFFAPASYSRWFGRHGAQWIEWITAAPPAWADVSIPLAVVALGALGAIRGGREARLWFALAAIFVLLALGPFLGVMGRTKFPPFDTRLYLPFKVMTYFPGLSAIRAPDRFMLIGSLAAAVAAGFGLDWLRRVRSHLSRLLFAAGAIGLVLVEVWPGDWRVEVLPTVPPFYRQIAKDTETYGVFDLPIRPDSVIEYKSSYVMHSSHYGLFQMTHGKGIATGYLAREFVRHPLFAHFLSNSPDGSAVREDVLIDGLPANRLANVELELARAGYRYVVFHKARPEGPWKDPMAWGWRTARAFVSAVFGKRRPVFEDRFTRVYAVDPSIEVDRIVPMIALRESWIDGLMEQATGRRWAISPASVVVALPQDQEVWLEITAERIHDAGGRIATEAAIVVEVPGQAPVQGIMRPGETSRLRLSLSQGFQTLRVRVGSTPAAPGGPPPDRFAIRSINLVTGRGTGDRSGASEGGA